MKPIITTIVAQYVIQHTIDTIMIGKMYMTIVIMNQGEIVIKN